MGLNEEEIFSIEFGANFSGLPTTIHLCRGVGEVAGKALTLITAVEAEFGDVRTRSQLLRAFGNVAAIFRPSDDTTQ